MHLCGGTVRLAQNGSKASQTIACSWFAKQRVERRAQRSSWGRPCGANGQENANGEHGRNVHWSSFVSTVAARRRHITSSVVLARQFGCT